MGGAAFRQAAAPGHPTLNTPRMNPAEYARLKEIYLAKIRDYFPDPRTRVEILKEAPEKLDYGDMDLFIGLDEEVDFMGLANAIGAAGLISHASGEVQKCTVGVPKDGSPSPHATIQYDTMHKNGKSRPPSPVEVTAEEYAQIDVNVIHTDLVDWHTFYSAYGDLNGLLGHIVTHLGFTVTDEGLWLRMKELDAAKKIERAQIADEDGKVFLSKDPERVMQFMGLSIEGWNAGFATVDELYEWLGACRVLHPVALKLRRDKAHDRNREQKRDVYRRFFFEWLPERMPAMSTAYDKEEQAKEIAQLREQYLDEALDFFDKRDAYEEKHDFVVLTVDNAIASNLLRPFIIKHSGAKAKKLPELMRAFRRFVVFDPQGHPYVAHRAHSDSEARLHRFLGEDGTALKDEGAVDEFVRVNWLRLKELERQRAKGRAEDDEGVSGDSEGRVCDDD